MANIGAAHAPSLKQRTALCFSVLKNALLAHMANGIIYLQEREDKKARKKAPSSLKIKESLMTA